jgi:anaerobic selenocysteine-containing dehydrogenase
MERIEKVFCGRMDHGGCGLLVQVEDGKIVKISGDRDSFTKGYICSKGRAHVERLYHPDRLLYPQKRIGAKGENRWQRISWNEAFETITERLSECKKHLGAEKALFMQGTPKGLENLLLYRFAHSLGSPNVAATGTVCFAPRVGAGLVTNGFYPHPDIEYPPELILVWGSNHISTNADGVIGSKVRLALKKGSRILLIDPAKTELAANADVWLRIKPGTDGVLALGMIKVMIEEGLYDQDFVEKWCAGFDELKAHVASYSLNDMQKKTWIPRKDIERTARLYAEAKSGCILWGNAMDHNINSVQTARALLILMALSGNLDRPGGNMQAGMPELVRASDFMLMTKFRTIKDKMIGKDFKLSGMLGFTPYHLAIKAVLEERPYEINTVYIQGTNPLMSYPNAQDTFQALKKARFLVVADLFMTPTAQLADIVLPVASHFEFNDLGYYGLPFGKVLARPKIVDPPGECISDIKIINELAMRLGLEDPFWDDEESCIDSILKPSGLSFQDLKKVGLIDGEKRYEKFLEKGFRTESGKVELYSTWMEKNGYAPLPIFSETIQDDEIGELVLTSRKINVFFHSMNRNLPSLRKSHPDPVVVMHPETAKRFRIDEGEWVWVENGNGRAKFKAVFQSEIDPRIVIVEHAWWFPEKDPLDFYDWKGSNINVLTMTDPPYEPTMGTMNLRGISCHVYKA